MNIKQIITLVFCVIVIASCTYKTFDPGPSPYDDPSLLDSAKNESALVHYKNDTDQIYSGSNGPHGPFKLKFNKIAQTALTDNGKLPVGKTFSNGSFIVKQIPSSGLYAFMYKRNGSWIWGEVYSSGSVLHSTRADNDVCVSCHSQSGQRDLVVSFNFY
jgi:hypothetical protein